MSYWKAPMEILEDEDQIGVTYEQLEEAMEKGIGVGVETLEHFNSRNKHKMEPIPTFKL